MKISSFTRQIILSEATSVQKWTKTKRYHGVGLMSHSWACPEILGHILLLHAKPHWLKHWGEEINYDVSAGFIFLLWLRAIKGAPFDLRAAKWFFSPLKLRSSKEYKGEKMDIFGRLLPCFLIFSNWVTALQMIAQSQYCEQAEPMYTGKDLLCQLASCSFCLISSWIY